MQHLPGTLKSGRLLSSSTFYFILEQCRIMG
jgi:hypothetical protein